MIPQDKIDEVIERASIVQIVGEHIPLKKRGAGYQGLCPFHSEKTPSFTVSDEKRLFYCFGCHTGGNVISFLMKREGMDFPEAVKSLAQRFGVEIVEERGGGKSSSGAKSLKDALFEANSLASTFFYNELRKSTGVAARSYLKKRGIDKETAETFQIGFSPDSWDGLKNYLEKNKVSVEDGEKAGVLSRKGDRLFDRFRGRVLFPILNRNGKVIAFGGRGLGDEEPKYLNSSDSPVFRKSEVLFGFSQARDAIRAEDAAIVCEGYFDQIALFSNGFKNTVATMGTALTTEHIRMLKMTCSKVYTIFDSDEAGEKAALRGLEKFISEDVPSRVIILPTGQDPDDYLTENGPEGMKKLIEDAVPLMEFFFSVLLKRNDMETPEGKRAFFDEVVPFLKTLKNDAEKSHYVNMAAGMLRMKAETLFNSLSTAGKERRVAPAPVKGAESVSAYSLTESTLLKVLLRHPELYEANAARVAEAFALLTDPVLSGVAAFVTQQGSLRVDTIADESVRGWISGALIKDDDGFIESPEKMLTDSLTKILSRGRLKPSTLEQIKKLEDAGMTEMAREVELRAARTAGKEG
ncbi:MAG: DNA primase [Thermodesulfobacteriota bacterium]